MIPGAPLIKGPGRYRYVLEALPAQAPRSQGSCAEDGEPLALIYAEHEGTVTLEEPLQVNLAGPGTLEGEAATQELDAQVAVRSYAVFLPAVQELAPRSLQLTFSQPILGVITQGELLQSSDGALALEDLGWSPEPSRGLEPGRDAVTLAPDGRTLTVRMDGRDSEDMVRVLVEVNR
jgi:hypothetical protein